MENKSPLQALRKAETTIILTCTIQLSISRLPYLNGSIYSCNNESLMGHLSGLPSLAVPGRLYGKQKHMN